MKKLTTEEFISKARLVHGDKYDYSKVEYVNSRVKVCIICPTHGEFYQFPSAHLYGYGCLKCPKNYRRIGINDVFGCSQDKSFQVWTAMLNRCYGESFQKSKPTYVGCFVCEEWLKFSNFKAWFDENYIMKYSLDKDILFKGNKEYSPRTCCFVPVEINSLLTNSKKKRGTLPIGVSIHYKKYQAHIHKHDKLEFLGTFDSVGEAFNAYKYAKEQYIKELAEKYFQEGKINERVYDALMRYEVEITD